MIARYSLIPTRPILLQPRLPGEASVPMLRFDRFMHTALFHPERGYYTSRIKTVGARGDFSTAATLSECLARSIARWVCDSQYQHLIEIGPGDGSLSRDLRRYLSPFKKLRLTHHLVETSPVLREQQKKKLPRAHHHETIQQALEAAQGEALIFSNELVDAFPVRIFRKEEDGYSELHFEKGSQPVESFLPVEELPQSTLFTHAWPVGQRLEVHESYHQWLKDWLPLWKAGQMLTIDYGALNDTLYHRRPGGSLRAYFMQDRIEGPAVYQNAGHQDLTADVSFTDLMKWGDEQGLTTIDLLSLREFLMPNMRQTTTDTYLTSPNGPGDAFQVLLQTKNDDTFGVCL
ncbi:MAG: SAM-dependent methyltransferase [Verrucomicrobiota bacterium JB023]|nr:SAM-dependent methyltransferase [Verrucomicrobiota bacterium JB023]